MQGCDACEPDSRLLGTDLSSGLHKLSAFKLRVATQDRDTVPAASPWAPRAGKKSEESGGRERRRTSSITQRRGMSCDHNLHVVSYLERVDLLCSTPAASLMALTQCRLPKLSEDCRPSLVCALQDSNPRLPGS